MPKSNEFARFIDTLRESRNIPRDEFIKGIISQRQYYRYVNEESSLKDNTIIKLLERLEINSIETHAKFLRNRDSILKDLDSSYSNIRMMNYLKAERYLCRIKYDNITSNSTRKYYNFLKHAINYHKSNNQRESSMKSIIELIEYPDILKKEVLTHYEISALFFVADYLIKVENDYRIAEFTYNVLMNQEKHYISSMPNTLLTFNASSARYLGKIGDFEKSLKISKDGILKSKQLGSYNSMANLLLFKAIAEKNLRQSKECKKTLIKLFCLLKVLDNENKTKNYKKYIRNRFDIEESDLLKFRDESKMKVKK